MAPGTGQRSTQVAQNEVSAMQNRPWMIAARGVSSATTAGSTARAGAAVFVWKDFAKAVKNPRLETEVLIRDSLGVVPQAVPVRQQGRVAK